VTFRVGEMMRRRFDVGDVVEWYSATFGMMVRAEVVDARRLYEDGRVVVGIWSDCDGAGYERQLQPLEYIITVTLGSTRR
jgi:hypothetical protein